MYRVNSKGQFNVPIGTSQNIILASDNFCEISELLCRGQIVCQDFEKTIDLAESGDFIFIDPPYTVKHNLNGFVQYNEKIFSWEDQIRLRDAAVRAVGRGAMITITNANHPSIHSIYQELPNTKINIVSRNSLIAGQLIDRGKTTEVVIRMGWEAAFNDLGLFDEGSLNVLS